MTKTLAVSIAVLALVLTPVEAQDPQKGMMKETHTLKATLTGAAETPGPGDPDGSGEVTMSIEAGQGKVCFTMQTANIDSPTAAHVHKGAAGASGPPVITLKGVSGAASGKNCVEVAADLIKAIQERPGDYYFNIHNAAFPDGAIRGQFTK